MSLPRKDNHELSVNSFAGLETFSLVESFPDSWGLSPCSCPTCVLALMAEIDRVTGDM